MPVTTTLHLIGAIAMAVQLLIFGYLYRQHRPPFLGYLIAAWSGFVVWKTWGALRPLLDPLPWANVLVNTIGLSGELLVVAAALAFRVGYRLRWVHAVPAVVAALFACASGSGARTAGISPEGFVSGAVIITGGLLFWPRAGAPAADGAARLLSGSLVLWGAHRVVATFVAKSPGSVADVAVNVTFVLFYFLTVFAIMLLVLNRARAEVASLKEFNERLVHGLGDGLQLVDGDFTVRHANHWMDREFGPAAGRRCHEVLTGEARPCPGCPLDRRETMDGPARLELAGAGDRRLQLTCSPVRQPDGRVFLLELVADVTERERLRARLVDAERLAAAGELAAAVAHEIRNPLAAIVNATTLLERPDTLSGDERATTLGAVRKEARRLNAILSDFLAFAGPRPPKRVRADLREVVDHVAALLREQRGHLRVETRVDPAVPAFDFDPDQLTQVIWNIALNAAEAIGGRGRVEVAVTREGGEVAVAVTDDGPGIPPEAQRTIFQPFYSRRAGGTGLGLAIADRIVRGHGGRIELWSTPGAGARFTVRLPLAGG